MKKTVLKYGIIGGLIMAVCFALSVPLSGDPVNYDTMEIIGYGSIILSLIAIFFGIKSYRDQQLGGCLPFRKGVLIGIGISAIASAFLGVYTFIHIAWIDPGFVESYSAWEVEKIESGEMAANEKQKAIQEIEEMKVAYASPLIQGLVMYATVFLMGIVISLISAAILKRGGGDKGEEMNFLAEST
ncbi:MAG: DUF4199 domain-containing protein [Ignavibacteriae bacterium]|nr:DUF4199 domain-containing protein [Ignavibacteriota bacterium]MCB9215438.1 DUF4199 domain-containing protein [Ignavibacteria bacterium]